MKCQECCSARHKKLHDDPRDPPLDEEACLCLSCYMTALDDVIAETEQTLSELHKTRDKLNS